MLMLMLMLMLMPGLAHQERTIARLCRFAAYPARAGTARPNPMIALFVRTALTGRQTIFAQAKIPVNKI
jgi:hypothetical protein